jgi:ribonuclease P protein component
MKQTLGKEERLKSRKLIDKLYQEGTVIKSFPLRMVYLQTAHTSKFPCQVGVSVSKRNFKLAVDRNRMKRLLRETYRKQKNIVYDGAVLPHIFMITFIDKKLNDYSAIEHQMKKILTLFADQIKNTTKDETNN